MKTMKRRVSDFPPRGARTRTQNLNRYLDDLDAARPITRSPSLCTGCGRELGQAHTADCRFAHLTTGAAP